MATLYRKYRPQSFSEVVGQNHVKVTLQNEIKQGNITHAYLFAGPRGIGKTTSARLLAKAINCEKRKNGEFEPCNQCAACEEVVAGRSLDVIEIDAASHTGVDNVRENIIDSARFTPNKLKYKVFIIDEVHMLSLSAFNALLKILEEPPAHVIFILCTTELHKIPATIISRCQRFDFRKVSFDDIVDHLAFICKKEGVNCDKQVLQAIARYSEGYLRDAIGLIGQILSLGEKKVTLEQAELVIPRSNFLLVLDFITYLSNKDADRALKLINRLVDEGINLHQFVIDLIEFLRKLLMVQISGQLQEFALEIGKEEQRKIDQLLEKLDQRQLVNMIESFISKNQELKNSVIVQLPLEMVVVEFCGGAKPVSRDDEDDNTPDVSGGNVVRIKSVEKDTTPEINVEEKAAKEEKKNTKPVDSGSVKLMDLKNKWIDLINSLIDSNHSLAMTLRVGAPVAVENSIVTVGFKYKFHQEMMSEPKNRLTLVESLSKLMGIELDVDLIVSDEVDVNFVSENPVIVAEENEVDTDVAAMFGGKIVS